MEKFNWAAQEAAEETTGNNNIVFDIPAGGYVMEIIKAEEVTAQSGNKYLKLYLDVAEGEYKGFAENAETATGKDWSYKILKAFNHTERTKKQFKRFLLCLEASNRKFKIERWQQKCDEHDLEGLLIGVVCDEELNEYNGKISKRVTPSYFKIYSIDDIEDGNHQKPRMLNAEEQAKLLHYNDSPVNTAFGADEIPF